MANVPQLRPDVYGDLPTITPGESDVILDSLCQFDSLQYLIQELNEEEHARGGYPASTAFSFQRVESIILKFVLDTSMQEQLMPGLDEAQKREILSRAMIVARRQAQSLGQYWDSPADAIERYIQGD